MTIIEKLQMYFQFDFVRRAFVVGILVALCAALLGVILVLKRFSFIGDGLSHVAFGAMAVAGVVGVTNEMVIVMPVTIACAVILLCSSENSKIKGDAAVALISVSALALGYLVLNVFSSVTNSSNISGDVCSALFGSTSILTLSKAEVWLCVGLAVAVIVMYVVFYNKIFAMTFDQNFARATGTKVKTYNAIVAVITAVIIVLAMNLVGSLLISALVIFPALSAMRVFKSFLSVTVCSAVVSVVCAVLGLLTAILFGTPIGSTIVAVDLVCFGIFSAVGAIMRR
ncbi:MAG: metal ABC transporter permease [Clostridiales bacterium]|nr:metal ABC transporter permease [Clostridiales bacterium]MDD7506569.1 metal ABC transporter permease [Clostridiales bacterium]MDY5677677.1 metal ABC transporter permease [Eubacteriales bacterium]MDY5726805.1 metal ABC transporter permease [Eubacteriales bacterium]